MGDHQYFKSDDSAEDDNENEADETELERILKKNDYYKKLKEDREFKAKQLPIPDQRFIRKKKSQMKQNDNETEDDGFGHKVKLLDIPDEDSDSDDGNPTSGGDEKNPYEKFYQRKSNGGRKKESSSTGKSPAEKENSATNLNFDQPI